MNCETCFCQKLRSCNVCNSREHIKDGKCTIEPGRFCTCRLCGFAIEADGYSGKDLYKDR